MAHHLICNVGIPTACEVRFGQHGVRLQYACGQRQWQAGDARWNRRRTRLREWTFEVDEIVAATGFQTPLLDLPELGVQAFGH
jgi:hypothetical protein